VFKFSPLTAATSGHLEWCQWWSVFGALYAPPEEERKWLYFGYEDVCGSFLFESSFKMDKRSANYPKNKKSTLKKLGTD